MTASNLYRDHLHGGWILELLSIDGWIVFGVYGTRAAAFSALGRTEVQS